MTFSPRPALIQVRYRHAARARAPDFHTLVADID